ncbi:uncharacterized protein GGS22DRAFT_184294 [Annulohypoxylon maeteangense]|uniref:uncharacterized protein n=1 Tax=Annulohypoxylon maeteangense TaxID=1927788 RepID=UPI002007F21A|nr:uncharacterized protein GGS22DRAFT_184294 [Annulohypoxylon maeteangense]KAI0888716.1 hypothetical protein GGS22DRAFT_184294 [Annulohypoxylon maeteangense]
MSSTPIQEARHQHTSLKRDTAKFKHWLERAALSCGWKPNATGKITTRDIAAQIDIVSSCRDEICTIPEDIQTALHKAIDGRKVCNEFFHSSNLSTQKSTASHKHFITILEHAYTVLSRHKSELLECDENRSESTTNDLSTTSQPEPINHSEQEWHLVQRKRRRS